MTYTSKPVKDTQIQRELQRISEAIRDTNNFDVLENLPEKPRDGMLRYFAAGVVDTGSTKGFYKYNGTQWAALKSLDGSQAVISPLDYGALADGSDDSTALQTAIDVAEAIASANTENEVVAAHITVDLCGRLYSISSELTIARPIRFVNGSLVARSDFSGTNGFMLDIEDGAQGAYIEVDFDGGHNGSGTNYADCIRGNCKRVIYGPMRILHFTSYGLQLLEASQCRVNYPTISRWTWTEWNTDFSKDYSYFGTSIGLSVEDADSIITGVIAYLCDTPIYNSGGNTVFHAIHPWCYGASSNAPSEDYCLIDASDSNTVFSGCYFDNGCVKIVATEDYGFQKVFDGCVFVRLATAGSTYRIELESNTGSAANARGLVIGSNVWSGNTGNVISFTGSDSWSSNKQHVWSPGNVKADGKVGDDLLRIEDDILFQRGTYTFGDGGGSQSIELDGSSVQPKYLKFLASGSARWEIGSENSGDDDFEIRRLNDSAVYQDSPLQIDRGTGQITFPKAINADAWSNTFGDGTTATRVLVDGAAGQTRTIFFQTNGSFRWQIGADATAEGGSEAGSDFIISRYGDDGLWDGLAVKITRSSGDVQIANDCEIDGLLSVDGGQIKFPATQSASADANTLDDYEETQPTLTIDDGTNSGTVATSDVKVTKIGNAVIVSGYIALSSLGSMTGNSVYIRGLGPVVGSASNKRGAVTITNVANVTMTAGETVEGAIVQNTAAIRLYRGGTTTGSAALSVSNLSATTSFSFSAVYHV